MSEQLTIEQAINDALNDHNKIEQFDFNTVKHACFMEPNYDYTDTGDAELQVNLVEGKVAWVDELNGFAIHGDRWKKDYNGAIIRVSKLLLQERKKELAFYRRLEKNLKDSSDDYNIKPLQLQLTQRIKQLVSHCKKIQSKVSIFAIRELFKAQQGITIQLANFDSKAHYIGVQNGIVDLRNGDFITNQPEYLMMKSMSVSFNAKAQCPKFKQFIREIMLGDEDMIAFIQRLVGQMVLGITNKDKFVILLGVGLNGKSAFIDLLIELMADYAEQTEAEVFTDKRNNKDYFKAELVAKRLVAMNESNRGDKLDSSMVKSCVRSGKVVARSPHRQPFSYQPMFTPVLSTNFLPYISQDPAVWERLLIIPFDYVVPDDKREPKLKEKLFKEEGEGILNWMIEGAQQFLAQGLNIPQSLVNKQQEYRLKSDRIAQFLSDSCVESVSIKDSLTLKASFNQVRDGYFIWCKMNNYQALGSEALQDELKKKGFKISKNAKGEKTVSHMNIIDFNETIALQLHDASVSQLMEM